MDAEIFIQRWTAREGGAERANYQMFLSELCEVIGAPHPDPASAEREHNDYVFERAVRRRASDEIISSKRIDLYKKGCFILEAKQSRLPGAKNAIPGQLSLLNDEPEHLGRRSAARGWDVMMQNARLQAENYVSLLDASHVAPPFIITCDVGHAFEIFADFSGSGRAYSQFPDRKGFRIYLEDLRRKETRELLMRIWTDPTSLDPAKESARVTREIAKRLAEVSKALEVDHPAEEVAHFLMRCIFTMFAEDVDLIPNGKFAELLTDCIDSPGAFVPLVEELWAKMDEPSHTLRFFSAFRTHLRHFNGNLFKNARAFPLDRAEIGELLQAAKAKWTEVDPAIFGTLLEQALEPSERRKLGAHYTPRAYVQRLVEVTVMEPLRGDWQKALTKAEAAKEEGNEAKAAEIVRGFHHQLCATRVLDPACGTGNFLYVSLELMKKLEGEVLETLARLGVSESLGLERGSVDPHQFLGLELNPRAAAIAELVVWIGYLQQHYRTRTGHPAEPILKAFKNINFGHREGYDAVLTWDGYPVPKVEERDGKPVEIFPNARRPDWPEAEFIVGNPPFLGKGAAMRGPLGDPYVDALWAAHPHMNESADFVMYWWDRAAELLGRKMSRLRRFGFVTTNSISQLFNRRAVERHLKGKNPISIVFAIPNHPWTKATKDAAAVRIAMTVVEAGLKPGLLQITASERKLETDEPEIEFASAIGAIFADLRVGANLADVSPLLANEGLASMGPALGSRGFVLTSDQRKYLVPLLNEYEKSVLVPLRNGDDLLYGARGVFVPNLIQVETEFELKGVAPHLFQYLRESVFPKRQLDRDPRLQKYWWRFRRSNEGYFSLKSNLDRCIVTVETAKHRMFFFVESNIIVEHGSISFGFADAAMLSLLSSKPHVSWTLATGGTLEDRPRYNKIRCFDPFPFPDTSDAIRRDLRECGEELDALRKRVIAEHPKLTLTGLYNVLEKLKSGEALSDKDEDIKQRGLVVILRELHERIDELTSRAYGWPADLAEAQILERLVALNADRSKEEAVGNVHWLRPDYQIPLFAKEANVKTSEIDFDETVVAFDKGLPVWPSDRYEQPLAVEALLAGAGRAMGVADIARGFKRGGKKIEKRVEQVLVTLARYGRVTALADGKFAARRAA